MKLREAIRTIVREVVGDDLRQIVREVLMEELMDTTEPPAARPVVVMTNSRSEAAKKAAQTRKANKAAGKLPKVARDAGLAVGQTWKGKPYLKDIAQRVIEIVSIDTKGIVPKIVQSSGKAKSQAKHISFERLLKSYDRHGGTLS